MDFKEWIGQIEQEDSPEGDLAKDIACDNRFPDLNDYRVILNHIEFESGYDWAVISAFKNAWKRYTLETRGDQA